MSQPALSRSILKLEEELGAPLFVRGKKEIRLTPSGVVFVEKAKQVLQLMKEAKEEVQEMASPDKGNISIAFLPTFGPHVLSPAARQFKSFAENFLQQNDDVHV